MMIVIIRVDTSHHTTCRCVHGVDKPAAIEHAINTFGWWHGSHVVGEDWGLPSHQRECLLGLLQGNAVGGLRGRKRECEQ